jgi:chemotaxis family two-component system response regulator Rcp1
MDDRLTVLLVEDNAADAHLVREAFREHAPARRLEVVPNGAEAMDYLRQRGRYGGALRPALILLDLKLPGKSGHEVLREIKEDPALRRIPVVVFSSSSAQRDVGLCYDLHANCCVRKPGGLDDFVAILRAIEMFWLGTIVRPRT